MNFFPSFLSFRKKVRTFLFQRTASLILTLLLFTSHLFAAGDSTQVVQPSGIAHQEGGASSDCCDSTRINTTRLAIVGGTIGVAMAGIVIYQSNGYWKYNRHSFHFVEDLKYSLSVDKIAHFWATALLAVILTKSFEWTNMPEENALYWGCGTSLFFNTYTEIQDGLHVWGFDRVDWLANLGGAAWPIAKYHLRGLDNVDLKWNYLPSKNLNKANGAFKGQTNHLIFDDYEGYSFWLSFKMKNILPEGVAQYWPDFLCLALGYGARDIDSPGRKPYPVWYVGLDYDMMKILPTDTPFLRSLAQIFNYIHFPAPAIRFSPSGIWYGLYFGQ